jgi:NO-binding membrane sensor protein with MHYT domain
MEPQPQYESPIPIENSGQITMIVVSTLSIFVPAVFIALRLYARVITSRKVDRSDWCIIVALVRFMALLVTEPEG